MIPYLCEVVVDCRLLPGQTQDEVEPVLKHVLGEGDYDFEWLEGRGGTRSELETPLWSAVESFVAQIEPEATVLPVSVAGFTDSHWLREAFGTVAYGFFPMKAMDPQLAARLIHSADERIEIDDLELAVDCFRHVAVEVTGWWLGFSPMAEKVRLGGMALVNGVLVHGPHSWACAVRTDDGELKVAAEYKSLRAAEVENPILRGPARLAEVFALLPAGLPAAARGQAAVPAAAGARGDVRDRARRQGDQGLAAPEPARGGARRRRALAAAGGACAARLRAGGLPRRRAHLDRQLRARRAARPRARALRLAPARPARRQLGGRGDARLQGAGATCAALPARRPSSARSPRPRSSSAG